MLEDADDYAEPEPDDESALDPDSLF